MHCLQCKLCAHKQMTTPPPPPPAAVLWDQSVIFSTNQAIDGSTPAAPQALLSDPPLLHMKVSNTQISRCCGAVSPRPSQHGHLPHPAVRIWLALLLDACQLIIHYASHRTWLVLGVGVLSSAALHMLMHIRAGREKIMKRGPHLQYGLECQPGTGPRTVGDR